MAQNVQFLTVSEDEAGQRLDNYLLARLKGVPKSLIYRVIRKGEVRVNKGRAKPERKLAGGDVVRVPPVRVAESPEPVPISKTLKGVLDNAVIADEPGYLVVNKPAGLAVHGGSGVTLGLIEALRQAFPQYSYLELVHRLDRDTSGCILVAKKRSMLRYLQELFRGEKRIHKRYLALVIGRWPSRRNLVDAPLLRKELQSGERIVRVSLDGKPSKTEFNVVQRFGESATLVEARPITGRTHQIRVHAQHQGHPLVGDPKYGNEVFDLSVKKLGVNRLFLHAAGLSFKNADGEQVNIEVPLPAELQSVVAAFDGHFNQAGSVD
ncbi:23S rRNA pseudouridine(955/2504/2580) synthase RluC [Saccharophagus degradans]|uniref:23S rRNA pseudouridine(955/2504/2580) synthase RluC n=1 Tax=Saccharophagus degradans TaxID=86304 RepID=UPI001C0A314C|nr:23S rRNA pseudouridine(955/2504/2580) synthase RluC [Saccharophagus degradans]MBU2984031.1 23S rRNA pseudouridine(955/2504/2580) synthase RluC [Saccharophagus degradans]